MDMDYTDIERLIPGSKEISIIFDGFTKKDSWRYAVGKKMRDKYSSSEEDEFDEEYDDYLHDSIEESEEVMEETDVIKTFLNEHPFKLISFKTGTPCTHCGYGKGKTIIIEYEINRNKERCCIFYFSGCLSYNPELFVCDV